jgi:hypothetical protein
MINCILIGSAATFLSFFFFFYLTFTFYIYIILPEAGFAKVIPLTLPVGNVSARLCPCAASLTLPSVMFPQGFVLAQLV